MKKKILTIVTLLVLTLVIGMLNVPVMAQASESSKGATVEDATADDTKVETSKLEPQKTKDTIEGNKQTIELVYDSASLKLLEEEDSRPADYAWIGVKVTGPTGATRATENDGTKYNENPFYQYFGVNLARLQEAVKNGSNYISYTKVYTWDYTEAESETVASEDKVTTTTLTIKINAEGIKLTDKDGATSLWNQNEYKTYKMEVELEELKAELERQGLEQAEIQEKLQVAEGLLAEQDLTIEELKAKIAELTKANETLTEADDTPRTGVIDVALISSVVAMISVAGIVAVKKYSK